MNTRRDGKRATKHHVGMLFIAGYAFLKTLLFLIVGIGALHFLNKDVDDQLIEWVHQLRVDPTSHFVNALIEKASLITHNQVRNFSIVAFIYAGLNLTEALGLYFEKLWAEYMTLIITGSFLPLELIELIHRQTFFRAALLIANLLVFIYLLAIITVRHRKH